MTQKDAAFLAEQTRDEENQETSADVNAGMSECQRKGQSGIGIFAVSQALPSYACSTFAPPPLPFQNS